MSDADARGWGPGWPNCQTGTIVTLKRADGLRLPVRREIAELVAWLIDETERRGYDVRPDWTWGYACRAIRGSTRPSNHSWGLAVDINAPTNPMGSKLITDMPDWMPALWAAYGFRWGGTYRTRPDAMHYEFMGTPADAARYTAQIKTPAPVPEDDMPYTEADLKRIVAEAVAPIAADVAAIKSETVESRDNKNGKKASMRWLIAKIAKGEKVA